MLASKPTSINHLWTSWSETCGLIWSDGLHIFCHNGKWMEINMIVSLGCWLEARCKRCSVEVTLWHPDSIYSTQSMQTVMDRMKAKQTVLNCFEMFYAFGHHTNLTIEFGPMSPHSNLTRRWITATSWRVCSMGPCTSIYNVICQTSPQCWGLWHSARSQRWQHLLGKSRGDSKCKYIVYLVYSINIEDLEYPMNIQSYPSWIICFTTKQAIHFDRRPLQARQHDVPKASGQAN